MWDEVKQDVVVTADIKSLSILPRVETFLQGQQNVPGRQRGVKDSVLQSPCKTSAAAAAQVLRPGVDLPAPRLKEPRVTLKNHMRSPWGTLKLQW